MAVRSSPHLHPSPLHLRPTILDIDLGALGRNFSVIRQHTAPAKVLAVVKANAYGHGLIRCAQHLEALGVDWFGVALVEEGIALRRAGIRKPILIFGGIFGGQISLYLEHNLDLTASSIDKLRAIDDIAAGLGRRARVHLKIDTGMSRIGVRPESAPALFAAAAACRHTDVVGIFSHLASPESEPAQRRVFTEVLSAWPLQAPRPLAHLGASNAILSSRAAHLDMVRAGLCLYGVTEHSSPLPLEPVLSLSSRVVFFKVVKKGTGVSYGHTWRAPADTRLVTVPVGYGDGYPRALSGRAEVLIRGRRYPIRGAICMDQIMVDVGTDEARNGDEVVLIGRQGPEQVTVAELADAAGTVPHEIFTALNLRVPRRYHFPDGRAEIETTLAG